MHAPRACRAQQHAYTFYNLMTQMGATAAGVCKGLQSAGVLAAGHALYCGPAAPDQCVDRAKVAAFGCVAAGVLLFSASAVRAAAVRRAAGDDASTRPPRETDKLVLSINTRAQI